MINRKLSEGLVWDKANGKDELRFGILEKQARDRKVLQVQRKVNNTSKNKMEMNWLEWRRCIERF